MHFRYSGVRFYFPIPIPLPFPFLDYIVMNTIGWERALLVYRLCLAIGLTQQTMLLIQMPANRPICETVGIQNKNSSLPWQPPPIQPLRLRLVLAFEVLPAK